MGRKLINVLKRLVIFKKPQQTLHFIRRVHMENDNVVIHDRITGISVSDVVVRAPRTSKRHVASADSYHPEDLDMLTGAERIEKVSRSNGFFECETQYGLK